MPWQRYLRLCPTREAARFLGGSSAPQVVPLAPLIFSLFLKKTPRHDVSQWYHPRPQIASSHVFDPLDRGEIIFRYTTFQRQSADDRLIQLRDVINFPLAYVADYVEEERAVLFQWSYRHIPSDHPWRASRFNLSAREKGKKGPLINPIRSAVDVHGSFFLIFQFQSRCKLVLWDG